MRFEILTLFPETFDGFLRASLIGKAIEKGLIEIHLHNIRDFAKRRRQADDRPYGGGPGMVLMPEPIYQTLSAVKKICLKKKRGVALILSPRGRLLDTAFAKRMAKETTIILLAGHYEGIDERVAKFFDGSLSIGPYVTMGGEASAMVVIETVSRYVKGILGDKKSVKEESFSIQVPHNIQRDKRFKKNGSCLEWPQYTRPSLWRGMPVPKPLLSGNHQAIRAWRFSQALPAKS